LLPKLFVAFVLLFVGFAVARRFIRERAERYATRMI
jgi:hypothetical protein